MTRPGDIYAAAIVLGISLMALALSAWGAL